MNTPWLTVQEAAARLRVSVNFVYRHAEIPRHKVGRLIRFRTDEIDGSLEISKDANVEKRVQNVIANIRNAVRKGGKR